MMGKLAGRPSWRSIVVFAVAICMTGAACAPGPESAWVGSDCGPGQTFGPGASLFGCDLSGRDLSSLDLTGADLRGAVLIGADLSGANLTNANLEGANLTNANLTGTNLDGAILAGAILLGALFIGASLAGVSFDFGLVYGANGNGGGAPSGSNCSGTYCAGFNDATVDNGHPLCAPAVGSTFGDWFYVHQTESQLQAAGKRSVVLDSSTSFKGATFDYSNQALPSIIKIRGLEWSEADFSDAIFINVGFGCQQGSGARFAGATFTSLGVGENASHWYVVDFKNSDFSNTYWTGVVMSTIDFSGSNFSGSTISNWTMENQTDFDGDGSPDNGYSWPYFLMRLDSTNWTGARIGMNVNPGTGNTQVDLAGNFNDTGFTSVSFANANLTAAQVGDVDLSGADLTGVTATNTAMEGPGWFGGANFTGGWAGANWVNTPDYYLFGGATCPDGSLYDDNAPCLP